MNSYITKAILIIHFILFIGCVSNDKGFEKKYTGVWISNDLDANVLYIKDGYVFYSEISFCILPLNELSKNSFAIKDTCLLTDKSWGRLYDKIEMSNDSLFLFHSFQYSDENFKLAFYPMTLQDKTYSIKSFTINFGRLTLMDAPFQEIFIDFKKIKITDNNNEFLFPSSLDWLKRINFHSFQDEYFGYSPPGTPVFDLRIETFDNTNKKIRIAGLHHQVPVELKGLIAACYLNAFLLQNNKQ